MDACVGLAYGASRLGDSGRDDIPDEIEVRATITARDLEAAEHGRFYASADRMLSTRHVRRPREPSQQLPQRARYASGPSSSSCCAPLPPRWSKTAALPTNGLTSSWLDSEKPVKAMARRFEPRSAIFLFYYGLQDK